MPSSLDQGDDDMILMSNGQWTAVASSTLGGYVANHTIDGSLSTFYHSAEANNIYEWVQVNFGKEIKVLLVCFLVHCKASKLDLSTRQRLIVSPCSQNQTKSSVSG